MIFFCSSRRRHTRCSRDWSSDVCSSDLVVFERQRRYEGLIRVRTVGYFGFLLERDVEPLPSPFPPELVDAARAALVEALLAGHTPHPDQARVRRALERLGSYWRRSGGRLTQAGPG